MNGTIEKAFHEAYRLHQGMNGLREDIHVMPIRTEAEKYELVQFLIRNMNQGIEFAKRNSKIEALQGCVLISEAMVAIVKCGLEFSQEMQNQRFFAVIDASQSFQGAMMITLPEKNSTLFVNYLVTTPQNIVNSEQKIKGIGALLILEAARVALVFGNKSLKLNSFSRGCYSFYEGLGFEGKSGLYTLRKERFFQLLRHIA